MDSLTSLPIRVWIDGAPPLLKPRVFTINEHRVRVRSSCFEANALERFTAEIFTDEGVRTVQGLSTADVLWRARLVLLMGKDIGTFHPKA